MFDIELLMADMKMTQNELATVLGVSQTAISKVKNGKMDIPETWVDFLNEKYDIVITKYFRQSDVLNDPREEYISNNTNSNLVSSILNLTESNKILAESVYNAIKNNTILIKKLDREMA